MAQHVPLAAAPGGGTLSVGFGDPGAIERGLAAGDKPRERAAILAAGTAIHHGAGIHRQGGRQQSRVHSARGLYQLTAANYHFNPNGVHSFGNNAVEEAQGGIRHIRQRYGTADNAAAFWQQHGWY